MFGVNDLDPRAVGDVEAVRAGVRKQIVPSALAADLPVVDDVVGLLRPRRGRPVCGDPGLRGCGAGGCEEAAYQGGGRQEGHDMAHAAFQIHQKGS